MPTKPYNLFSDHLKKIFGRRIHKISVDAGFSCPNRSGTRNLPGCLFCNPGGSGAIGIRQGLSVRDQLEDGKEVMTRKYKAHGFLAYFQPFSNTFAPVEKLRALYDEALAVEGVVGLAVGTRPDCISAQAMELLAHYAHKTYFWLELGLQSIHDTTLSAINRGHDYQTFLTAFGAARELGIQVCVHVILGLPGEDRAQMLATAEEMARLKVDGIKIHLLHILEDTPLADLYNAGRIQVMEQAEYISLAVDFIERLHPETLIHRLTGDGPRDQLLAPLWSLNKWEVINAIHDEFRLRNSCQGKLIAR
ncbi:MAG: TIGR01212 family radical SAM protein [Deltaproteobacteria bacterium]|nr:TIGR01212 family radical SAM protein [Deltaproteobacteria bacterium]